MKRYSVSELRIGGKSKNGMHWQYVSRTDDPNKVIEWFENTKIEPYVTRIYSNGRVYYDAYYIGLRIVDSQTKEVVYCNSRINDLSDLEKIFLLSH